MLLRRVTRLVQLMALFAYCQSEAPPTSKATERHFNVLNESGSRLTISWVHPTSREKTLMSQPHVMNGAAFPINSFVGHEFSVEELPSVKTGKCKGPNGECRTIMIEVSENAEQSCTILKDLKIQFVDDQIKAKMEAGELVGSCQKQAKAKLEAAMGNSEKTMEAMDSLVACVETGVAGTLARANEEIAFQASVRKQMAEQMENYTCVDPDMDTSTAVKEEIWSGAADRVPRQVKIMLDRPASRIHVVENFIKPEECQGMEDAARPKLHRATVADGQGGSEFSENRKAMQAGIKVPWNEEKNGNPIAVLSRRVYDYTEHVLGLGIEEFGQEDLMSIQYFGRGGNDTAPDRYMPHCDGDCAGLAHKTGTRMATMVMYCKIPESGGHTNFRNAGVHVKPKTGSAVFFSYIDPETKLTDNGFTEHSGCPVYAGEKKIVTQWIRYGVDKMQPWNSFNTLGVKIGQEEDEVGSSNDEGEL